MAKREKNTDGPYIRWLDYGYEGWHPDSYDTLAEALEDDRYNSFVITKAVQYEIKDKTT